MHNVILSCTNAIVNMHFYLICILHLILFYDILWTCYKEVSILKNTDKRKLIGKRIEERRKQLSFSQGYLADQLGVNQSTITRYEKGTADNEKLLVLNALSSILHVSVSWLIGETDDMESAVIDNCDIQIKKVLKEIQELFPLELQQREAKFSKELLLLLLLEYKEFNRSLKIASEYDNGSNSNANLINAMGFDSTEEFREILFLREITHSINTFTEISDVLRNYAKNPDVASNRIHALLSCQNEYI